MFENSCYEKYWNRVMITDQHILASRTESRPLDELNKGLCFQILLLQQAQIPQEQTEKLKNKVLIEPSLNQEQSPSPGKMGQLSTQRRGRFPPSCLEFHYFFGSVQKTVLLVTCHKQEILILTRDDFHVLGKLPSCYKML